MVRIFKKFPKDVSKVGVPRRRRLAAKIGAAFGAALACLFVIMVVSGTLRQVSNELPQYGFYSIRDLHIMLRDTTALGDAVAGARLAPANPESLERLSEANDLAYIRFVRVDREETIKSLPEYGELIDSTARQIEAIDAVLAKGLPFDPPTLLRIEEEISEIEKQMNEYYYSFGANTNIALADLQSILGELWWEIIASLLALSVVSIGSALLLVNRHEVLAAVRYLASHDQTTGVHNRNWMSLNGQFFLREAQKNNHCVSVALIDLDHFKSINDTFGHHIGDQVLEAVGETLLRFADTPNVRACRIGGDEFVIIVSCENKDDAHALFADLSDALNQHVEVETHRLRIGASIGTASFPEDGQDLETLLKNADHAVYAAKGEGRGRVVSFSSEILSQVNTRSKMESRLQPAMQNDELPIFWQPQFRLATGHITGLEALVRWRDPATGNIVEPSEFIQLAERSDLILELDRYVLRTACSDAVGLLLIQPELTFAVNLSGKSFQDAGLPSYVKTVLDQTGLSPDRLEIEITESVFIGNRVISDKVFSELVDLGVKLAIDDFGTGYSNLASLAELPLDRIKIDRSFIKNAELHEKKRKLVLSILAFAKSLDIDVVAEGVENNEQMELLIRNQCQYAQGFYLSHPLPKEKLETYLLQVGHTGKNEIKDTA
ncbi:MAG: bifunctional diguanylate cyclase/phosphodiesterase [Alphaproteobacteria bacterium]|nr:bifunctional diguanylate cyclase/phosphodiesterase [Alphaproteobacteria bacterium]